jgi:1,4-alpha-glucan branching enzyme
MRHNFYGSFVLVLHFHIPYVLHHDPIEEEMILEATAETYIPLLNVFYSLVEEGISPKVTCTISPVLAEQLANPYFKTRFEDYCLMKADFARRDQREFEGKSEHMRYLARRWEEYYTERLRDFNERYEKDLIGAFRRLQDEGHVELMTCGATHAYFPVLCQDTSIQAQVKMAVKCHTHHFGRQPRGIWLPECGYRPACHWSPPLTSYSFLPPYPRKGIEEFLSENDLEFFVVDYHQLVRAWPDDLWKTPLDTYYVNGPRIPKKPVTIFVRDFQLSFQVWSHDMGYPGDGVYLDFHKRHADGKLRYWKITHNRLDMAFKDLYYPDDAAQKLTEHAGHYKWLIAQSLKANYYNTGQAKLVMTAFDAELFGHWWFEGPQWLYHVLKWVHADPEIKAATCSEYMDEDPASNWVWLPESSWGNNFDNSTWMNKEVEWVLERVYHAEHEIQHLARAFSESDDANLGRILRQVMRELFILQASDWEFMITNWSTRNLAEKRVVERHEDFKRLAKMAWDYGGGSGVDEPEWRFLQECELRNEIFMDPEIRWFR